MIPTKNSTHILIVDDDRQAGKSLALMLTATGFDEIRTVRSAARALAIAATFHPAIAFVGKAEADAGGGAVVSMVLEGTDQPFSLEDPKNDKDKERIEAQLAAAEGDLVRSADLFEQSARAMLADLDEWRLVNQQQELSVS